ncbi:hypothetical protein ElyMa_006966300 [Elysia marginata]|uniref:Uncharacterized protein n=1 Tax=Elysia marginata TaxID=1093978 RepID=A0AAV4JM85_9GAST|nr:hypothetical protein ElyMa_006966300 [Elysia marginata]
MSFGLLVALTGPLTVSNLTPTGSYSEWRVVWSLMSAIFFSASLVFFMFGQAKIQPWANTVPEAIGSNKDLEQPPTEMSMEPVRVIEVSLESSKFQEKNGHTLNLQPEASPPSSEKCQECRGHAISQNPTVLSSQSGVTISSRQPRRSTTHSKQSSDESSSSKTYRDNPAFERDSSVKRSNSEVERDNTPPEVGPLELSRLNGDYPGITCQKSS